MRLIPHFGRTTTAFALFTSFVVMALLAAAVSVIGFSRMSELNTQLRKTAELRNNKLSLVEDMAASARARTELLLILNVTHDPLEQIRAQNRYPELLETFRSARDGFQSLSLSPEEAKLLEGVMQAAERAHLIYRDAERIVASSGCGRQGREQVLLALKAREELETELGRLLELQRTAAFREVADASEINQDAFRFALMLQAAALAVSLLVGVAATWLVMRSERQLQRGKELAQATLNALREGVISVDAQGLVRFMNPRAETLTGWTSAEAKRRPLSEVYSLLSPEGRTVVIHPANSPLSAPMASSPSSRLGAVSRRLISPSCSPSQAWW